MSAPRDDRLDTLLRGALDLTTEHDLDSILEGVVRSAADVADARYAAAGVYDSAGRIERFVHHGIDPATVERIGTRPQGRGLLGEVTVAAGPLRLHDLRSDPRAVGFPPHHPRMCSFLGVLIRMGERRFGNLYLTDKRGGDFDADDERLVVTLAGFAAAAIEGAVLVATERNLAAAEERGRAHREMLARVIDAQEAERARVARDLHDQIGQALTSVLLGLRLVDASLSAPTPEIDSARVHTDEVRGLVADALNEVRQLAFDLRPTVLDDIGLMAAVQRLTADLADRNGQPIELSFRGMDDDTRLAPELETVLYRVIQEALTNVVRHARAGAAAVVVSAGERAIQAVITDDGVGFTVDDTILASLGLAGMRERAALLDGHVDVTSAPGEGSTVTVEIPR